MESNIYPLFFSDLVVLNYQQYVWKALDRQTIYQHCDDEKPDPDNMSYQHLVAIYRLTSVKYMSLIPAVSWLQSFLIAWDKCMDDYGDMIVDKKAITNLENVLAKFCIERGLPLRDVDELICLCTH